jgi:mannose-1-phosphate guanylyltransferase
MAKVKRRSKGDLHYQERGWGGEVWIENIPQYCGKILEVKANKRGSLHFHMKKTETMYLLKGFVELLFVDPDSGKEYTVAMSPGDSLLIPAGQVHQIHALQDSEILEVSTMHEESDSYRVLKGD